MPEMRSSKPIVGVAGFFNDSHELLDAARKVKGAGVASFETYSPFPIHGMDDAMGLKRSPIPYVTFAAGLTGFIFAFGLQYWTSAVDWPLIIAGKPFNSWPAFVPVMFELTVLFGGLATFGALLFFCKLPNQSRKAIDPGLTQDKFALVIEASKKAEGFDADGAQNILTKLGAKDVRKVYAEGWFE